MTPVERLVENAWFQRLKLKHENLLSSFASNFNLRRYMMALQAGACGAIVYWLVGLNADPGRFFFFLLDLFLSFMVGRCRFTPG